MADEQDDKKKTRADFKAAINLTPGAIEKWLDSPESKEVGRKGEDGQGPGESVGHKSGKQIVEIRRKRQADLDDDDYAHMRKVISYVHRHLAQRPDHDVETSRWRYSLMNWGHDPCKKSKR